MKYKLKIVAMLLSLLICLSMISITAYADDDDINGDVNSSASQVEPDYGDQPVEPEPDQGDSDYVDPGVDDGPDSGDAGEDNLDSGSSDTGNSGSGGSGYDDGNDYDNNYSSNYDNNYDDGYSDNNNDYNYEDNNSYGDYNYDSGVNSYDDNSSSNYSNTQDYSKPDMYQTNGDIDINELSDSDWNAIALSLENAEDSGDDGDDFNFIKKNNSSSDNGLWMLILGAVLVILSIAGIAYVVITYMNKKKAFSFEGAGESTSLAKRPNRTSSYKSKNDYGDGYSTTKSRTTNRTKRASSQKRIEDTADIVLPKSRNNKNSRNRYR